MRNVLDGVKSNAVLLISRLSFILDDLVAGCVSVPFPARECVEDEHPFRLKSRAGKLVRPQVACFVAWLKPESAMTCVRIYSLLAG